MAKCYKKGKDYCLRFPKINIISILSRIRNFIWTNIVQKFNRWSIQYRMKYLMRFLFNSPSSTYNWLFCVCEILLVRESISLKILQLDLYIKKSFSFLLSKSCYETFTPYENINRFQGVIYLTYIVHPLSLIAFLSMFKIDIFFTTLPSLTIPPWSYWRI